MGFDGGWRELSRGACWFWWLVLLSSACKARGSDAVVRYPPSEIPVTTAAPYTAKLEPSAVAPDSICATEPERCPSVDLLLSGGLEVVDETYAGSTILLTGPLAGAPAVSKRSESLSGQLRGAITQAESQIIELPGRPRAAPNPTPRDGRPEAATLREVQVHLDLDVEVLTTAMLHVRKLIEGVGGQLVSEVFEDTPSQHGAALSIRVPVEKTSTFLEQVSKAGRVLSRRVESKDIGRKVVDAELLLRNLKRAIARYEELLEKAQDVADIAGIEASLARLRTQVERVQGDLAWLSDLGTRSTIYLKLSSSHEAPRTEAPEAKLWPGVRGVVLFDLGSQVEPRNYAGAAFSYLFSRSLGFDAALLRSLDGPETNLFSVSLGGDFYSDYLGGGERRYLNPFLGFRSAYLHRAYQGEDDLHEAALGVTLGLEVVRTEHVLLDVQGRGYAAFASRLGLHAVVEPSLGLSAAF